MEVPPTNAGLLNAIAAYGDQYRSRHLVVFEPSTLEAHPLAALDFFLSRACFQGRRDDVSERVYQAIKEVLFTLLSDGELRPSFQQLQSQDWAAVTRELQARIGRGKIGKARDIEMVTSTLKFIGRLPDLNIVNYSVNELRAGEIAQHYSELQASPPNGIVQVGPKIAALYLRDLVSIYHLEAFVPDQLAFCLQPVDVWVRRVAQRLGIPIDKTGDHQVQIAIVTLCRQNGISPLLFNQGAWYIGHYSFDIVLDLLGNQPSADSWKE